MSAATADRVLSTRALQNEVNTSQLVAASTKIYQHTLVGLVAATGYARPLVAGDKFIGLATEQADNSDGAAGDISVKLRRGGQIRDAVTGVTGGVDVGKLVYATDDNVLTLTAADASLVGVVVEHISSTTCWVHLFTAAELAAF